ncbi:MAG: TetR/AcrR family transcriptional regulator [Streptosporangiaceae bacterium]
MTAAQATGAPEGARRGRPRSERADKAIINATIEIFAESGADGLCIEQVAAKAGVGKATIYRRWPGKEELLLDALASLRSPLPQPKGESVRDDLTAILEALRAESADPRRVRQFALLLGEGERYPRLLERYVEAVLEPRREVVRTVLRRGVATGELREGVQIEAAADMLTGAVLARARRGQDRSDRGYARRVVEELLTGLASR